MGSNRADDVAREGADDLVPHRAGRREPRRGRDDERVPVTRRRPGISWMPSTCMARRTRRVVACFGDSITDGTASTLNGDDRWPDVLSRRLHAAYGDRVAGGQCRHRRQPGRGADVILAGDALCRRAVGARSSRSRRARFVGVSAVIWLEGINDLSAGATPEAIIAGFKEGVRRLRARRRTEIIGADDHIEPGATSASGTPENDTRRKTSTIHPHERIVRWRRGLRWSRPCDADGSAEGPVSAEQHHRRRRRPLHPNRAGYQAMANAIDSGCWRLQPRNKGTVSQWRAGGLTIMNLPTKIRNNSSTS